MKILHFSDTHLGFSQFSALNEQNINVRESDFYNAFSQVVDEICSIKPDFVIHCGDFFHKIRPSNLAISFALKELKRIEEQNIPFILIAGNHSTPKLSNATCIFEAFSNFKNIYASYKQVYEKISFEKLDFYCLPHINSQENFLKQIELCEQDFLANKKNNKKAILLLHSSFSKKYLALEFGERIFPLQKLEFLKNFDYVAFGHWHKFSQVAKNAFYSGSLERTSLNDKSNEKGFILLDLKDELKVEFKKIKIRQMLNFNVDFKDLDEFLFKLKKQSLQDKLVNLKIKKLSIFDEVDINKIQKSFENALHLNIKKEYLDEKFVNENLKSFELEDRFLQFLEQNVKDEKQNQRLINKAKEFFTLEEN